MIIWGVCLRGTQVTGGENRMRGDVHPAVLLSHSAFYWAVPAGAAVVSFAIWRFVCSPFGMTLCGIRDSESGCAVSATICSASVHRLHGVGLLRRRRRRALMFNNFVSPSTVALEQSVEGVLMMIAGGVGTLFGAHRRAQLGISRTFQIANLFCATRPVAATILRLPACRI